MLITERRLRQIIRKAIKESSELYSMFEEDWREKNRSIIRKWLFDEVMDGKELREYALKEQDPLVTKVLRLSYEYLGENNSFDIQAQYEEDEEENEYPIEIEDVDNFLYLQDLADKTNLFLPGDNPESDQNIGPKAAPANVHGFVGKGRFQNYASVPGGRF